MASWNGPNKRQTQNQSPVFELLAQPGTYDGMITQLPVGNVIVYLR